METKTDRDRLERVLRGQFQAMDQVHLWLKEESKHDALLRAVVLSSNKEQAVDPSGLEPEGIYHIEAIKELCVKYRLRFLNSGLFKGPIPDQAVAAIRHTERQVGAPITSFKIMAPSSRFKLCDSEVDPLLFVPVGNDRYYLVHKWGTDLAWHRVLTGWAFRSPVHLGAAVLALAMLVTAIMPAQLITSNPDVEAWGAYRVLFFFWVTMVCSSFTVFGWFAFFGQFSSHAWNSKYFNA